MIFLTFDVRVSKSKFEQVVFELLKYIPTLRIIVLKIVFYKNIKYM